MFLPPSPPEHGCQRDLGYGNHRSGNSPRLSVPHSCVRPCPVLVSGPLQSGRELSAGRRSSAAHHQQRTDSAWSLQRVKDGAGSDFPRNACTGEGDARGNTNSKFDVCLVSKQSSQKGPDFFQQTAHQMQEQVPRSHACTHNVPTLSLTHLLPFPLKVHPSLICNPPPCTN